MALFSQEDSAPKINVETYLTDARVFRNHDKLDLALEALKKASDLAEKNEDAKTLIDCYNQFALLYLEMDKQDNTQFFWDRTNVLLKDVEYPYGTAVHKYIEALLLFRSGKNFQAIYMLNEAKQLNNDRNLLNLISLAEANIYLKIEKYDSAEKNFNSLVVNSDIYEKDYLTTKAYLGLANLAKKNDNLEEGIKNASEALKLATLNGFYKQVLEANEILSSDYEKMGLYDSSLVYNKRLLHLKDSIFTIEKLKVEGKTADNIQFNIMSDQLKKQDQKIDELNESANRSEITAILMSTFMMIISLLAISLYRNNQIKLKTNDLLLTKNNELQAARDAAVQAMETKITFLSTVSHELRTPLYAVTGLTHLLMEENPSENQKEHLKALKFSGDYLLNFINDILQINKIDANKLEPSNVEFNLKKVLMDVKDSMKQSIKSDNTKIVLDYDKEIPVHLLGDPLKLSQVFMNLVGNALKFTKQGEVTLIAKLKRLEDNDATIYCEVRDTGIGIPKDQHENVFDSFHQGSVQINREYGGTGLGLTIVKSLLALLGSEIHLESESGKGSSFFFEINLKSKDELLDDITFQITEQEHTLSGLHLLIVEDNRINQVITKKMLAKKEITSDIANNGTEAIEMTKKNKYDAILMDIHMPGISGEEATIEIRKFDKEIPIIALTAISMDDSLESFYAAGCNDVVTKPFKPEVFYQKIGENIFGPKVTGQAS
ncbi:response regulator [Flavobacteriaceae bacterium F89]|uniref:histidine kinase n=1 Tax=Cerina litoralis TaxID=2874477 RepID=A0AAE3EY85_9FLAO|nr:response regulator [Cerina litoralis]